MATTKKKRRATRVARKPEPCGPLPIWSALGMLIVAAKPAGARRLLNAYGDPRAPKTRLRRAGTTTGKVDPGIYSERFRRLDKIPIGQEIYSFMHCARCFRDRPSDVTPREWARLEVGWTELGVQVRCVRCDVNVIHIDLAGAKIFSSTAPGQTTAPAAERN